MRGRAKRSRFNEKLKVTSHHHACVPIITEGKIEEMKDLKQGVREYRELMKKKYSIEITQGEAEEQFKDLLALFRVIYRPIPRFDGDSFSKYNQGNEDERE